MAMRYQQILACHLIAVSFFAKPFCQANNTKNSNKRPNACARSFIVFINFIHCFWQKHFDSAGHRISQLEVVLCVT